MRFRAPVLSPVSSTAVLGAFLLAVTAAASEIGLAGTWPLYVLLLAVAAAFTATREGFNRWLGGPDLSRHVRLRMALLGLLATLLAYASGWGAVLFPAWLLALLGMQRWGLPNTSWRIAARWVLCAVPVAQVGVAVGWFPHEIGSPEVHAIAAYLWVIQVMLHVWGDRRRHEISQIRTTSAAELSTRDGDIQRMQALIEHSADVVMVFDQDGVVTWVGPSIERVMGRPAAGQLGAVGLQHMHPDDRHRMHALGLSAVGKPGIHLTAEARLQHGDGTWRWHLMQLQNLLHDPAVQGYVMVHRDISERRELEERLTHHAFHDPLTDLPNRALFFRRLEAVMEEAGSTPVSVVIVDLDGFKDVNDTLGHLAGDEMLRRVAAVLLDAVRDTDTVARLGGDEFALLLPDVADPEVPVAVAERVLRVLGEGFPGALTTSASIGIAVSVRSAKGIEQLMSQADLAMYAAKQRGKSRYAVYEPSMGVAHHARLELAEDLGRALATEDELHVAYQPVVDLSTGRVKGVEALARWRHPIDGDVPPSTFIPLAEANGMVVPLGLRVLNEACRAAAAWRTGRPELDDFTVSVNLSARQLESPTLLEDVDAALTASRLPAANLQLEVTETVLVEDAASAARVMHALKARGVRLALDDFGTGYSSLRYLNQFPLDVIKIDRSFVSGVHHAGPRGLIVETVLHLAHGLGLTTIAEGIEQPEERDYLIGLGCQEGQGFLFARPQSAEALELLLATEHALLNP